MIITREQALAKVNAVFDQLDKLAADNGGEYLLHRIMLEGYPENGVDGVIIVERTHYPSHPFVTWGVMPYDPAIHSGHYDMDAQEAHEDWLRRLKRMWS